MKNYGIILASGTGSRYGSEIPKQFVKIAGKTVMEHTLDVFEKSVKIDEIILVVTPAYRHIVESILLKNRYKKISKILNGGETRKDSSSIALNSISDHEANVIIHDCARPFLSERVIDDCAEALKRYDAVDVAIPSADTIIKIKNSEIAEIPNRAELMRGQTPQCFKLSLIKKAHRLAENDNSFTDDCGLIVKYNLAKVYVVEGEVENIKITYPSDIFLADRLFQIKSIEAPHALSLENLQNKVIVVFGGTSGIGKCICAQGEENKARVFSASDSLGCDITDYQQVCNFLANVYKQCGRIDYVVNSAGILRMGKLIDRDIEDIRRDVEINYLGSINIVKAAMPYLQQSQGGILLFTSSSYTRGRSLYSTYSSAKAGIVNLTQALAEELASDKIRINVINPERTATPMRLKAFGQEPEGSLLSPEIVAAASLKTLLSDITGQVIDVRRK